jgi:hypothetical protein
VPVEGIVVDGDLTDWRDDLLSHSITWVGLKAK